jgi:nucleoside-diphosphate-sugar epimerase
MKILIVGGTRFIGRNLVSSLVKTNVEFVLTSRRINPDVPHSQQIICDREEFNKSAGSKQKFDLIVDFNGYNANQFYDFNLRASESKYFFVSTAWIDRPVNAIRTNDSRPSTKTFFNSLEGNYVKAKKEAEDKVIERYGQNAVILRLPIVLGFDDHHKRLDYTIYRITNSNKYILPSNGNNILETILVNDVSTIMLKLILNSDKDIPNYLNFKPPQKTTYLNYVSKISSFLQKDTEFVDIEIDAFTKNLGKVAACDPFWRESESDVTGENAFQITNSQPTNISGILPYLLKSNLINAAQHEAFSQERTYFARNRQY